MIANITAARNAFPELFAAQESLAIGLRNFLIGGNSPLPANYASPRAPGPVIGALGGARDRIMLGVFAASSLSDLPLKLQSGFFLNLPHGRFPTRADGGMAPRRALVRSGSAAGL
jgi:hypothetical protein